MTALNVLTSYFLWMKPETQKMRCEDTLHWFSDTLYSKCWTALGLKSTICPSPLQSDWCQLSKTWLVDILHTLTFATQFSLCENEDLYCKSPLWNGVESNTKELALVLQKLLELFTVKLNAHTPNCSQIKQFYFFHTQTHTRTHTPFLSPYQPHLVGLHQAPRKWAKCWSTLSTVAKRWYYNFCVSQSSSLVP